MFHGYRDHYFLTFSSRIITIFRYNIHHLYDKILLSSKMISTLNVSFYPQGFNDGVANLSPNGNKFDIGSENSKNNIDVINMFFNVTSSLTSISNSSSNVGINSKGDIEKSLYSNQNTNSFNKSSPSQGFGARGGPNHRLQQVSPTRCYSVKMTKRHVCIISRVFCCRLGPVWIATENP